LAAKHSEKDRYVRLYAQGHISESELEVYLADLKNHTDNLRLLIESLEADLSQRREQTELAETTAAWLITLRERIAKIEEDTEEAFRKRRQLVKLLIEGITASKKEGRTEVRITYRFDPPGEAQDGEDAFLSGVQNSSMFSSSDQAFSSEDVIHARCSSRSLGNEAALGSLPTGFLYFRPKCSDRSCPCSPGFRAIREPFRSLLVYGTGC